MMTNESPRNILKKPTKKKNKQTKHNEFIEKFLN